MSDNTTEHTPLTLPERMVQAGCEIVGMHTGLSLELCQHIFDKCIRRAATEFGTVPYETDGLTLATKFAIAQRAIEYIGEDLIGRKILAATIHQVQIDLDTFYRGVRGIPPAGDI